MGVVAAFTKQTPLNSHEFSYGGAKYDKGASRLPPPAAAGVLSRAGLRSLVDDGRGPKGRLDDLLLGTLLAALFAIVPPRIVGVRR